MRSRPSLALVAQVEEGKELRLVKLQLGANGTGGVVLPDDEALFLHLRLYLHCSTDCLCPVFDCAAKLQRLEEGGEA